MCCSHCTAVVTIVTGKCAVRSCCTGPRRHCYDSLLVMTEEATSFLGDPVIWVRLGWRHALLIRFHSEAPPLLTIPSCAPKKPSSPLDYHREDRPSLHLSYSRMRLRSFPLSSKALFGTAHLLRWPVMALDVCRVSWGCQEAELWLSLNRCPWVSDFKVMLDVMMKFNYESNIGDSLFSRSHSTQRTNEKQNQEKQLPDLVGHTCNPGLLRDGGRRIAKTNPWLSCKTLSQMLKKKGLRILAQWYNACLACEKPWG